MKEHKAGLGVPGEPAGRSMKEGALGYLFSGLRSESVIRFRDEMFIDRGDNTFCFSAERANTVGHFQTIRPRAAEKQKRNSLRFVFYKHSTPTELALC